MSKYKLIAEGDKGSMLYFYIAMMLWTIFVGSAYFLDWRGEQDEIKGRAIVEARSHFNKDLVYRRWATMHGGVYVPMSEKTPPNPYLSNLTNRDVVTTSGMRLTLVNPAYMTRQVHELGQEQYGARGHITSLKPFRPENRPDAWEEKALLTFEENTYEISSIETIDGQDFMRFMRPIITEEGCLKCHMEQGYKVGDVRGGISVSIPLKPYREVASQHRTLHGSGYALIGLLGLSGIWFGGRSISGIQTALEKNQYLLSKSQELGHIGTWSLDISNNKLIWTEENCRIFDVPIGSIVNYETFLDKVHPDDRDYVNREWHAAIQGKPYDIEHRILVDGRTRWVREKGDLIFDEQGNAISGIGFTQDVTDQKQSLEENRRLERQLQQAQKMESIGLLAGGVAHDFNNMLGVILGHSDLALMKADADNPFVRDLEQIQTAAKRSADLTRQLLTFARKETIDPKILNLNEAVTGILTMLQRLIRETVNLSWNPGSDLWSVRIDTAQLNQILTNLCINARDAIDGTGTITITTQNYSIAEGDQKADFEIPPGDYVCLSIADDGPGIDQEKLKQIFEPFFTTKEFGKGTGLGLSSVYGAVKQNQGFIDVVSEPGQGATFQIYLPRIEAKQEPKQEILAKEIQNGSETILLVEDDQMLLTLTKSMLEESGYTVLEALTSDQAIALAKEYPGPIHLLLSDIVMPEMNGKDLRDNLLGIRPEMNVIFMSGYTDDVITQQGVLEEDTHFLQKPISLEALTSKVQEVLDKK